MVDFKPKPSGAVVANKLVQNRAYFDRRHQSLRSERESWMNHWKQISDYLYPVGGRFFLEDRNLGGKRNDKIINDTGTDAHNTMAAGMMAVMSSPARPWFELGLADLDLMKFQPVKAWLEDATRVLRTIFARSNVYRVLHQIYLENSAFGTACAFFDNDFQDLMRLYPTTIGEFMIAQNNRYKVDTLYREFQMQVGPIVKEFGVDKVSNTTKQLWDKGEFDAWIDIVHAIEPRIKRDANKSGARNMPFISVYWEPHTGKDKNISDLSKDVLRERGFKTFRGICPRYNLTGSDVYGTSVGMNQLGNIQSLQDDELTLATVKEYQSKPPLQIPSSLRNTHDVLPGGSSFYNENKEVAGIRTAFEVNLKIDALLLSMERTELRIRRGFHNDLLVAILRDEGGPDTAKSPRAIEEKSSEKLLIMGPTFERHSHEVFDVLIDNGFEMAFAAGILGDPPQELLGADITIKYISMLAQVQRAVGIGAMDRIIGTVGVIDSLIQGTKHKLNGDQLVDEYAEALGLPADVIVPTDRAVFIRKQEQKALAQAQETARLQQVADAAKTLSETDTQGQNALTQSDALAEVA